MHWSPGAKGKGSFSLRASRAVCVKLTTMLSDFEASELWESRFLNYRHTKFVCSIPCFTVLHFLLCFVDTVLLFTSWRFMNHWTTVLAPFFQQRLYICVSVSCFGNFLLISTICLMVTCVMVICGLWSLMLLLLLCEEATNCTHIRQWAYRMDVSWVLTPASADWPFLTPSTWAFLVPRTLLLLIVAQLVNLQWPLTVQSERKTHTSHLSSRAREDEVYLRKGGWKSDLLKARLLGWTVRQVVKAKKKFFKKI